MATSAGLSARGFEGFRAVGTLDSLLGSGARARPIKIPDRHHKWYALGPYRALLLEASKRAHEYDRRLLDYADEGQELPARAALLGDEGARATADALFARHRSQHEALEAHEAFAAARASLDEGRRSAAKAHRSHQLRAAYQPNGMNPWVELEHRALKEAGVPHHVPALGLAPLKTAPPDVPTVQFAAAGIRQGSTFPSFEELNGWHLHNILVQRTTREQNRRIERARSLGSRTWSS
jgi:hypothetical protein